MTGQSGELFCEADPSATNRFYRRGFWRMSPGGRNLVHVDGTAALLVGDMAWASRGVRRKKLIIDHLNRGTNYA